MASVVLPPEYMDEYRSLKISLSQFNYKEVASGLAALNKQEIVAGMVGCIIPESGSNHRVMNREEYYGRGKNSDAYGWACGEGLIGWTFKENKLKWIRIYNNDSRSTQKLPTDWATYSKGTPVEVGGWLCAPADGKHIAGLTLQNQLLLLTLYWGHITRKVQNEQNLAAIVAWYYMEKAGPGFHKEISDIVKRAYATARDHYPSRSGNHYLQSVKCAADYLQCPVAGGSYGGGGGMYGTTFSAVGGRNAVTQGKPYAENPNPVESKEIDNLTSGDKVKDVYGVLVGTHIKQK